MEARNNSANLEHSRNAEQDDRPLPPLPAREGSLERVDESLDDSDIDEEDDDDDEFDEIYSDEEDSDVEKPPRKQNNLNEDASEPMLVNGNHENEESFDANATLPPSPSKSTNTTSGGTEPNSVSNSSYESALFPDSERYGPLLYFRFRAHLTANIMHWFLLQHIECGPTQTKTRRSQYGHGRENPWNKTEAKGLRSGCRGSTEKTQVYHNFLWCCFLCYMLCIYLYEIWLIQMMIVVI